MHKKVHRYLLEMTPERPEMLQEMERYAAKHKFPIIGPLVGRLLYQMALSIKAKRVLELGSGYGYSALWFAMAIGPKGEIVLTDGDKANKVRALEYIERSRLRTKFDFRVGNALNIARNLPGPYDIILNDIDKQDYPRTIDLAAARLRKGGLFITDNLIWSGRVADKEMDKTTRRIVEFTRLLYADKRFFTTVLPIRDGVGIAVRI
ncbi:MAG: O-methyltransferase [bacterium]|nr:O-methyltransferase [bacterium]